MTYENIIYGTKKTDMQFEYFELKDIKTELPFEIKIQVNGSLGMSSEWLW